LTPPNWTKVNELPFSPSAARFEMWFVIVDKLRRSFVSPGTRTFTLTLFGG
jgi:hypothetical protein